MKLTLLLILAACTPMSEYDRQDREILRAEEYERMSRACKGVVIVRRQGRLSPIESAQCSQW